MPLTVADAEFPALSVTVPTAVLAPLAVRTTGSGQVATPDRPSAQVNATVTGPTYQPLSPLLPLATAPLMVGAVRSSLTVTESLPRLPALSRAEPETSIPAVSSPTRTSGVTVSRSTP